MTIGKYNYLGPVFWIFIIVFPDEVLFAHFDLLVTEKINKKIELLTGY